MTDDPAHPDKVSRRTDFSDWDVGELIDFCAEADKLYWWLHEHMDDLPPRLAEHIQEVIYTRIEP